MQLVKKSSHKMPRHIIPAQPQLVRPAGIGAHVYKDARRLWTGEAPIRILVVPIGQIPQNSVSTNVDEVAYVRNIESFPQNIGENVVLDAHQERNQILPV